jgi:PST family polysaccharide transporter
MSFRKAVSFGALQTLASLVAAFASVKITSVYLGPSGVAIMGQLQYFIGMVSGGVTIGLRNGVVRRVAELGKDMDRRAVHLTSVLKLLLVFGLPVSALILVLSDWLAVELLHDAARDDAVRLFGLTYVAGLVASVMVACAVGVKNYKTNAGVNIANGFINVGLFGLLCPPFGLQGALLALAIMPLVNLLVAWLYVRRAEWWPQRTWSHGFQMPEASRAMAFIPAALITAIGVPLVQLLLRDQLLTRAGIDAVGWLHSITRLSDMSTSVLFGVFGMYFAPRFAELRMREDVLRELSRALALFLPLLAIVSLLIYWFRDAVVVLVFTREFYPMRDLFAWQLFGTFLKILSWIFQYVMVAKGNPYFIGVYQLATLLIWFFAGRALIELNGAVGATQAYALHYGIYAVLAMLATAYVVRQLPSSRAGK